MANDAELGFQLDREFDQHLADMKPYVLKLPHKAGECILLYITIVIVAVFLKKKTTLH